MGATGEAITAYAQPLFDATDGSIEQMERAMAIAMACWNLAELPEDSREECIHEMQRSLALDDAEFELFRRGILDPMLLRHEDMFPGMHGRHEMPPPMWSLEAEPEQPAMTTLRRDQKYPGIGRNSPCPCKSGRKFKHCCGR